ncbi:MAG: dihydroorotase [Clostridiales bacterium]|nr:dihydroorotase [Clostridiales bacterium]
MTLLIKNGIVVNPGDKSIKKADILVEDGIIAAIAPEIDEKTDEILDAMGLYVMPGFIDMHVHLRDPGLTYKEDIATGGAAALHGGFTTIVAMPNTDPVVDCVEVYKYVEEKAAKTTKVHVIQAASVTKGMKGGELSDIRELAAAGCIALSEDGKSVMDSGLYREAMKIAAEENMTVLAHCEDANLVRGGVMNLDENSERMGLPGISNSVEDVIAMRDIILARETGARLHLCHCSTKDSVAMVRGAKEAGVHVSAEVCPHHFSLTSADIPGDDGNYKMNPPLRTAEDVEALRRGLSGDVMDVISTDHAPHHAREKSEGMLESAFGIVGLETAAALVYTYLVKPGYMTIMQMAEKMSANPARILGLDKGVIRVGAPCDITIFDSEREWVVDPEEFKSKGENTPFAGMRLSGKAAATVVNGEVICFLEPYPPKIYWGKKINIPDYLLKGLPEEYKKTHKYYDYSNELKFKV